MQKARHHIENCVEASIRQIESPLLLTISGGADSMSLFHACRRIGTDFIVAHCNFHLRGDESNRDEAFVRNICTKYNIKYFVKDFDVQSYCIANSVSEEMACRELRYAWFKELKSQLNASRILTAHNADDNIETFLLNLFRGTGIEGMKGMNVDTGEILRPLLNVDRKDIEHYLAEIGEPFITDSSNLSSDYKRNYIRNILLPMIENKWEGVRKSLHRTINNISGAYAFYNTKICELLSQGNSAHLSFETIKFAPHAATLIHEFLKKYDTNYSIIEEISTTINNNRNCIGKKWILGNHIAVIDRDGLSIIDTNQIDKSPEINIKEIDCNKQTILEMKQNKNHFIIYLPGNFNNYLIRKAKIGDRIRPLGMKGSQLISDIIKDAKLNNHDKHNTWVLEEIKSGEIVWIIGLKRSRYCLIQDTDQKMLKVTASII